VTQVTPEQTMRRHAKSFHWAARFLSPTTRADTELLYAFARHADDLADEPELGTLPDRLAQLAQLKDSPALAALAHKHAWKEGLLAHFLNSLMADTSARQLQNQNQLLDFAYGVAGTVGLMMRPVLGAPVQADPYAMSLGLAMQLTNIARDVVEDAQQGRVYIAASYGVSAEVLFRPGNAEQRVQAFAAITRTLALAEELYTFAQQGLHLIPAPNQRAIRIALSLYRGIGRKIVRRGAQQYWHGRVHLGLLEKLALTLPLALTPLLTGRRHSTLPPALQGIMTR
jgi:15-cis-phytoene synthase